MFIYPRGLTAAKFNCLVVFVLGSIDFKVCAHAAVAAHKRFSVKTTEGLQNLISWPGASRNLNRDGRQEGILY